MTNKYSLAELNTQLALYIKDVVHIRWTVTDLNFAIRQALMEAHGRWWEERVAQDTYIYTTDFYDLPPACVNVEEVWFADSTAPTAMAKFVPPSAWCHSVGYLQFTKRFPAYDGYWFFMVYRAYPTNLLTLTHADGVIAAGALTVLTSALGDFINQGVREGDAYFQGSLPGVGMDGYVREVRNATTLELDRAQTAGAGMTYWIAPFTEVPYMYIMYQATANLLELGSRNRPGVTIDESLRLATYYRQLADNEIKRLRRPYETRRRY